MVLEEHRVGMEQPQCKVRCREEKHVENYRVLGHLTASWKNSRIN